MDKYIRALRKEELLCEYGGWFDDENAERVLTWLVAAEHRRPVVLVGAGFTRNARDVRTGRPATATQAPLWGEVVARLAGDLGVAADRYDAPTLFEIYQEALGEGKLRDALRDTVDDATLTPADAHAALATYSCEAIVTTNCLDTLLDRACTSGWRRIVVDADLSGAGRHLDLVYLHGHRDFSDSWVMTRSQYEDFSRKKPVMIARTRQLLAQHPWLIVGFGMTDPNFHAIARLLGLEMRAHQPLSLALMRDPPLESERQHWRRLGFEIASPDLRHERAKTQDLSDFFAWVFPKLSTSYSPTSAAAKAYIQRGVDPAEKLRRFRDVYSACVLDREGAYEEWKLQLRHLLDEKDQKTATDAAQATQRIAWRQHVPSLKTGLHSQPLHVTSTPETVALGDPLFAALDVDLPLFPLASFQEIQCLVIILTKIDLGTLAEHFKWSVEQRIFEAHQEIPWEVIALRVAKRAGWSAPRRELVALLSAAFSSARKYGRHKVEALLEREARELGLEIPAADAESFPDAPHLQAARSGHDAFMNAEFEKAADAYGNAAKFAAELRLDFEEWVYAVGQADAITQSRSNAPAASDERLERLRRMQAVESWLKRADAESRAVLLEDAERGRERRRLLGSGGWGLSFGGRGHALWKSFRDLETIHAPPSLRRRYLEPLLFRLDASDIELVLQNAKKPREWIEELLSHRVETLAQRRARDAQLAAYVVNDGARLTKTVLVARLRCLSALGDVLSADDVTRAVEWLDGIIAKSKTWMPTARDFWTAFSAIAPWAETSRVCDTALKAADAFASQSIEDAVIALYRLPWAAWPPLPNDIAVPMLAMLTRLVSSEDAATTRGSVVAAYGFFTLLKMLDAGLAPEPLLSHVSAWQKLLDALKQSQDVHFGEARRAGFLVEKELVARVLAPRRSAVDLFGEWFGARDHAVERQDAWIALAESVDGELGLIPALRIEVERLLQETSFARHYGLNPHLSYAPLALLTKGMKFLEDQRAKVGRHLVLLLSAAPDFMHIVRDVLVRDWWREDDWQELMQIFVTACGGSVTNTANVAVRVADDGARTRQQIAALTLFGDIRDSSLSKTAPLAWQHLRSFALSAVNDERMLVSNRAAFSVVSVAKDVSDVDEAKFYAAAIERIAGDPRVSVRSAVAHVGVELMEDAHSALIREAARAAVDLLEEDENAQVRSALLRARPRAKEKHRFK